MPSQLYEVGKEHGDPRRIESLVHLLRRDNGEPGPRYPALSLILRLVSLKQR